MLTYPEISPIIFSIGPLAIRWYGMMYVISFLLGWWLARRRSTAPHSPVTPAQVDDLVFNAMLGIIIGGRVGYVLLYGFDRLIADPLYLFRITEGGMSFHGGLVGVMVAMWWFGRSRGKTMLTITDFIAPFGPLGLMFGRIGNFINGELWGGPAGNLPWAMRVSCRGRYDLCQNKLGLPEGTEWTPPLHPSMLYEAFLEGLVLFVVLWVYSSKPRPYRAVSALFLLLYGLFRFAVEFVRRPDSDIGYLAGGWLTMGHVLSVPMIVAGAVLLFMAYTGRVERTA